MRVRGNESALWSRLSAPDRRYPHGGRVSAQEMQSHPDPPRSFWRSARDGGIEMTTSTTSTGTVNNPISESTEEM